jgi:hypothetical protein
MKKRWPGLKPLNGKGVAATNEDGAKTMRHLAGLRFREPSSPLIKAKCLFSLVYERRLLLTYVSFAACFGVPDTSIVGRVWSGDVKHGNGPRLTKTQFGTHGYPPHPIAVYGAI